MTLHRFWLWLGLPHWYVSTACLHGKVGQFDGHAYCQSNTGSNGQKVPASCKFCEAPCRCRCHRQVQVHRVTVPAVWPRTHP